MADQGFVSNQIRDNAIIEQLIADGAISANKIGGGAVTNAKMAADSVDSDQYVDGSIDTAHYAANSVDTAAIAGGAVGETELANNAVTTNKIDALAVTGAKIAGDAIDGTKLADNAVDSEHYTDGSIDTAHYAANSVDNTALAANSVDSDQYVDGSIDAEHFSAGAVGNAALGADAVDGSKIADDAVGAEHIEALDAVVAYSSAHTISNGTDIPHKDYVDSVAAGFDPKASVRLASANFAAVSGDYDTTNDRLELTGLAAGTTFGLIDGVEPSIGDRILIKDMQNAADETTDGGGTEATRGVYNGIYEVIAGAGTTGLYLQRAVDHNTSALVTSGNFTFSSEGSTNEKKQWVLVSPDDITLDAELKSDVLIEFTQFGGAGSFSEGGGIDITGTKITWEPDNTTLELGAGGDAATAQIKDGGVSTAKLAADAVDGTKLADDAVDSEHIAADSLDEEHLSADVQLRLAEAVLDEGTPSATENKGFVAGSGNEGLVEESAAPDAVARIVNTGFAYNHLGARIALPAGDTPTFDDGDGSTRWDIVVLAADGTYQVRKGGVMTDPTLTSGDIPLARVVVDENPTPVINTADITDLRERKSIDGSKIIEGTLSPASFSDKQKLYSRVGVFFTRVTGTGGGSPTVGAAFTASGGGAGVITKVIDSTTWELAQFSGARIANAETITSGSALTNITKVAAYDNEPDAIKTTFNCVPVPASGDAEQFNLNNAKAFRNGQLCEVVTWAPTRSHECRFTQSSGSTQGTIQFGTAPSVGERVDVDLTITN